VRGCAFGLLRGLCLLIGGHGWFRVVNSVGCTVMALCANFSMFDWKLRLRGLGNPGGEIR
jgi:hypothetical protein